MVTNENNINLKRTTTRKEEIIKNAKEYTLCVFGDLDDFSDVTDGFINGAKWADEHPKIMIDKTCEWIGQAYSNGVLDWRSCDAIINNFKKVMEE